MRRLATADRAAVLVVGLLFLLNPLLHLHYRAPVSAEAVVSAPNASATCSVCRFQTNIILAADATILAALQIDEAAFPLPDQYWEPAPASASSSRAPPRPVS